MNKSLKDYSMKNYVAFLSLLTAEELAAYIVETGRSNGQLNIKIIINSSAAETPEYILSRSFDFKNSVNGPDFWAKIFKRLSEKNKLG